MIDGGRGPGRGGLLLSKTVLMLNVNVEHIIINHRRIFAELN
jgi:hypothetical protein